MKKPYEKFKNVGDCYEIVVPDPKNDARNVTIQGEFRGLDYNYDSGMIDILFWEFGGTSADVYYSGDIVSVKPIETPSSEEDKFFTPYKERTVELGATVDAYRNLHTDNGYSIRDSKTGLVLAHSSTVHLKDARFVVSESGRMKTVNEKRKRVHAYIRGTLLAYNVNVTADYSKVLYNPYYHSLFTHEETGYFVKQAEEVICCGKFAYAKGFTLQLNDKQVRYELMDMNYDIPDNDDSFVELAINEGFTWNEKEGMWSK